MQQIDIMNAIKSVTDPEIPVLTIDDLGVLRRVEIDPITGQVLVEITPTYTGCPAMDMIEVNIRAALEDIGVKNARIQTVLSPAWTTDWISEEGKMKLKAYGIAPPAQTTKDKSFFIQEAPLVQCPLCDSERTEMISRFGSTACKSLYKCLDCMEPFDYFKCH